MIESLDDLEETIHYPDTGCRVAPSCLACPLVFCRHDVPKAEGLTLGVELIVGMKRGKSIPVMARERGIAPRTAYRWVATVELLTAPPRAEDDWLIPAEDGWMVPS